MKANWPRRAPAPRRSAPRPAKSSTRPPKPSARRWKSGCAVKLAEAEKTIASTREAAMSNVRGIAADAAAAIVQRLTGVPPDGKSVDSAVDASLKG